MNDGVHWTHHAIERLRERFGGETWRKIPYKRILESVSRIELGETIRVRNGAVIFACQRVEDGALILTVLRKNKRNG